MIDSGGSRVIDGLVQTALARSRSKRFEKVNADEDCFVIRRVRDIYPSHQRQLECIGDFWGKYRYGVNIDGIGIETESLHFLELMGPKEPAVIEQVLYVTDNGAPTKYVLNEATRYTLTRADDLPHSNSPVRRTLDRFFAPGYYHRAASTTK